MSRENQSVSFSVTYQTISDSQASARVELPQNLSFPPLYRSPPDLEVHGSGKSAQAAQAAAWGEAVERYSLVWQGNEKNFIASSRHLGSSAIVPSSLLQFSREQYEGRSTWNSGSIGYPWIPPPCGADDPIRWSPIWSLTRGDTFFVPTQAAYFYSNGPSEPLIAVSDTNGCAAGATIEAAVTNALLELVERDAIALWWTARLRRPALAFPDSDWVRALQDQFDARHRQIHLIDLTTDIPVPVVAAVAFDANKGGRLSFGFGASLCQHHAAERALRELLQNEPILELPHIDYPQHSPQRAHWQWYRRARLEAHPHLIPCSDANLRKRPKRITTLQQLLEFFDARQWNVCALDLTRPETNTHAVRIVAPDLAVPYYRLGSKRLQAILPLGAGINPDPFAL
jgi:oxazoline/thiazoline synthase